MAVLALIAAAAGYHELRKWAAERQAPLPPLASTVSRALRLMLVEDERRWRITYAIATLAVIAVVKSPAGGAAVAVVTLVAVIVTGYRVRTVLRARDAHVEQMFNVASGEFRYPRDAITEMDKYVHVETWHGLTSPTRVVVKFPARVRSEDEKVREAFERNFGPAAASDHGWAFTWKSAKNEVLAEAVPFIPKRVDYRGDLDSPWDEFPLGEAAGGEVIKWQCSVFPHALIAGSTGAGKSAQQRTILLHVLQHPDEWRIVLIDPKRVELSPYAHFPNVAKVATELEEMVQTIVETEKEMQKRYKVMRDAGVNHFRALPDPPPAMLVMVDEVFALLSYEGGKGDQAAYRDELHTQAALMIGSIARLGRAAGIHLVLATQRPDAKVLAGETKLNLDARIACGRMDTVPSLMVLDSEDASRLDSKIKGRALFRAGATLTEYQGFFLEVDQVPAVLAAVTVASDPSTPPDTALTESASRPSRPRLRALAGVAAWWTRQREAARLHDEQLSLRRQGLPATLHEPPLELTQLPDPLEPGDPVSPQFPALGDVVHASPHAAPRDDNGEDQAHDSAAANEAEDSSAEAAAAARDRVLAALQTTAGHSGS